MSYPTTTQMLVPYGANVLNDRAGNQYTPVNGVITVPNSVIGQMLDAGCTVVGQRLILAQIVGLNFNITTDQAIALNIPQGANFLLDDMYVTNPSISLTTAAGGLYTAASKGGTALVASSQAYSGATAATAIVRATVAAAGLALVLSQQTLYFALTTGQGAAATADVTLYGRALVI